jgi:hypothetical protein
MVTPALIVPVVPSALLAAWPVNIDHWAIDVAAGQPVSAWTPIAWLVAMAAFLVGGIVLFRRQEL